LSPYDRILIAMGPQSKNFLPLKNLPISAVKGQILELKWPATSAPLPHSLISQKYIVMSPDQKSCLVGSTFEHKFSSPLPDQEKAIREIMPNITTFFPALENAQIIHCRAAFRASSTHHLPLVGKISDKYYFFTGLGSKGLLYHAWIGKLVARALLTNDPSYFPSEINTQIS
ncbi:MAG TPA: FAD-dependent oxidoreductase, partial [Waddliaceae bacterium]